MRDLTKTSDVLEGIRWGDVV